MPNMAICLYVLMPLQCATAFAVCALKLRLCGVRKLACAFSKQACLRLRIKSLAPADRRHSRTALRLVSREAVGSGSRRIAADAAAGATGLPWPRKSASKLAHSTQP